MSPRPHAATLAGATATNTPTKLLVGTAAREDLVTSRAFAEVVPTPGEVFSTSAPCTVVAQFVTEARVTAAGHPLQVRVTVDGRVANPGPAVLTSSTAYGSSTYVAFQPGVQPGNHTVTVQAMIDSGQAYVRNRSFTVCLVA